MSWTESDALSGRNCGSNDDGDWRRRRRCHVAWDQRQRSVRAVWQFDDLNEVLLLVTLRTPVLATMMMIVVINWR